MSVCEGKNKDGSFKCCWQDAERGVSKEVEEKKLPIGAFLIRFKAYLSVTYVTFWLLNAKADFTTDMFYFLFLVHKLRWEILAPIDQILNLGYHKWLLPSRLSL